MNGSKNAIQDIENLISESLSGFLGQPTNLIGTVSRMEEAVKTALEKGMTLGIIAPVYVPKFDIGVDIDKVSGKVHIDIQQRKRLKNE